MVPTSLERRATAGIGVCDGLLTSLVPEDTLSRSRMFSMNRETMTDVPLVALFVRVRTREVCRGYVQEQNFRHATIDSLLIT